MKLFVLRSAPELLLIIVLCLLSPTLAMPQPPKKIRKVVALQTQQTFYLNGGMRATFGGKSRVTYAVELPKNTVEWYYVFTTQEGERTSPAALNLVPQLTRLVDPTGTTAIIASAIMCPTGSNACDIVLLNDKANANAFENKAELSGGTYYYTKNASRENYRNGTVQIKDILNGVRYLGFRNPSASTGITVTFEAAAIVEEIDPNYEKAVSHGNLGWKAYEAGDVDKCILYSKKALELYDELIYVKANLGLCYMRKDDELTATDYYIDAMSGIRKLATAAERKAYIEAVIKDITDAEAKGYKMAGSKEVLEMYREELRT